MINLQPFFEYTRVLCPPCGAVYRRGSHDHALVGVPGVVGAARTAVTGGPAVSSSPHCRRIGF